MKRRPRKTSPPKSSWLSVEKWRNGLLISAAVLALLRFVVIPLATRPSRPSPLSAKERENVQHIVRTALDDFFIREAWQERKEDRLKVSIPMNFRFYDFYLDLNDRLKKADAEIVECIENARNTKITATIGKGDRVAERIEFVKRSDLPDAAGLAAIIIDDFGYSYNEVTRNFLFSERPLTISIIPKLRYSEQIAREARLAGKDVFIHMPMEPLNDSYEDDGLIILTALDAGTIRLRIREAISLLPEAIGMNNHQGSRATADVATMEAVLSEVKRRGLIFVDSRTNPESVALRVARRLGVPAGANRLFLDAEDEEDFIEAQLNRMADLAHRDGRVIAIGHVRKKTFRVLDRVLPELEMRGLQFVPISRLIRRKNRTLK